MKITIEHHNSTVTSETSDGDDIFEVVMHIKSLLVAAGFHPKTVEDVINIPDLNWFDGDMNHIDPKVFDYLENIYKPNDN